MKKALLGSAVAVALIFSLGAGPASAAPITSVGTLVAANGNTYTNFTCVITQTRKAIASAVRVGVSSRT